MTLNLALKLVGCVLLLIGVFVPHAVCSGSRRSPSSGSEPFGTADVPANRELPVMNAAE